MMACRAGGAGRRFSQPPWILARKLTRSWCSEIRDQDMMDPLHNQGQLTLRSVSGLTPRAASATRLRIREKLLPASGLGHVERLLRWNPVHELQGHGVGRKGIDHAKKLKRSLSGRKDTAAHTRGIRTNSKARLFLGPPSGPFRFPASAIVLCGRACGGIARIHSKRVRPVCSECCFSVTRAPISVKI